MLSVLVNMDENSNTSRGLNSLPFGVEILLIVA